MKKTYKYILCAFFGIIYISTMQGQFIQNRAAFIARDSVSSPVYNKGTDTLAGVQEIAGQIHDSLLGKGLVAVDGVIQSNNKLYETKATGVFYSGVNDPTEPSNFDSTAYYDGTFGA